MSNTKKENVTKKDVAKGYESYAKQFTPSPPYFLNGLKAFVIGGALCTGAFALSNLFLINGVAEKEASMYTTIILVVLAQLLTGLGVFDTIAKFAGAGVIVPITGYANSMVAPALEYKREGPVLGVGSKLFSIAGPVLACGISAATIVGIVAWLIAEF